VEMARAASARKEALRAKAAAAKAGNQKYSQ
jgi:hypothetical protein